jgi:cytochrome b
MHKILVFDLKTRIFHWFFAAFFLGAFYIAKLVDSEAALYGYHMILGMTLFVMVVFRIYWGFFGTKHAKFSSFPLRLSSLFQYLKSVFQGQPKEYTGYNPAASWSILGFLLLASLLFVSGILMSQGYKEDVEDYHEIFANCFFGLSIWHVLGVIVHSIQFKTCLPLAMISGKKPINLRNTEFIDSLEPKVGTGVVFGLAVLLCFVFLYKNFDASTRVLSVFGYSLNLGETEE